MIHLEQQTPPSDFQVYGPRVVPFYNYLQAAFVVHEDERLNAEGVLRVAAEMVTQHRFDGDALARSYHDLGKRGHLRGTKIGELETALASGAWDRDATKSELVSMVGRLPAYAEQAAKKYARIDIEMPNYLELVSAHNRRRRKKK